MDYVYKGEVEVSKEQLNELINAGKVLQIKGLQEMVIFILVHIKKKINYLVFKMRQTWKILSLFYFFFTQ